MDRYFKYAAFVLILSFNLGATTWAKTKEDSILALMKQDKSDTERLKHYYGLSNFSVNSNDLAMSYAEQGLKLAQADNDKNFIIAFLQTIGNIYSNEGSYSKALEFYLDEVRVMEEAGFAERKKAGVYNGIGNIYSAQNNFDKALEYYDKGLKILKAVVPENVEQEICFYNNIGSAYIQQRKYDKAVKWGYETLKILGTDGMATDYDYAGEYDNMGTVYDSLNIADSAMNYYSKAQNRYKKIGMNERIASTDVCLGNLYLKAKEYDKAIAYYNDGILNAQIANANGVEADIYNALSQAYAKKEDFKQAYEYHEKYTNARDSLMNAASQKQLNELETKYESATKDKELLQKDAESKHQKILTLFVMAIAIAIGVIAVIIFRSLRISNKQKQVIEKQKILVEEKNKEVLDSITYAKRLQEAILPPMSIIKKHLPESFILYKPKDIVAGDFYWFERIPLTEGEGRGDVLLIAACDCTGHGVPGAMVSVVCSSALNRALNEFKLRDTGKILDKARELVLETFAKNNEEVKDGMDCSFCAINTKTRQIEWSGAYNPLWYITNGEMKEIAGDKQPVGKSDNPKPFTNHSITLPPNVGTGKGLGTLYLFTDGYADQFGGPKGKKFMHKQLQQLLVDNAHLPMEEQKNVLEKTFNGWKGSGEQIDDVLVIGIRV